MPEDQNPGERETAASPEAAARTAIAEVQPEATRTDSVDSDQADESLTSPAEVAVAQVADAPNSDRATLVATPVPATNAPQATVKSGDHWILLFVAIGALAVLVGFGIVLFTSGFVAFPDLSVLSPERGYFEESLAYRERRVTLALLLRTFITGFSFVVGLALCTMGGLFILRQVTSLTTITGHLGVNPLKVGEEQDGTAAARRMRETQFAFSAYSPGVVFMLGGVVIIAVTQYLAIPVTTIEVLPKVAVSSFRYDDKTGTWQEYYLSKEGDSQTGGTAPATATPMPPPPAK